MVVAIDSGDIMAVNGWFRPGLWTDIEIFRHGLMEMVDEGERVEADNRYRGESRHIDVPGDCMVTESAEEVAEMHRKQAVV